MNTDNKLPTPILITHAHLLACLNTELNSRPHKEKFRILDAGCGDGKFIAYLQRCFSILHPDSIIELYGYDVVDHGVQTNNFASATLQMLDSEFPDINWSQRIEFISADSAWPWPDGYFDLIVSNQVLEHVHNTEHFFSEHYRVLSAAGVGFHLFPLVHSIYEGHLFMPWVHRLKSWDAIFIYIRSLSRLGIGKFPSHHKSSGISLEEFAEKHADYMYFWTRYRSEGEFLDCVRKSGLRGAYRFTSKFYLQKLLSMAKRPLWLTYSNRRSFISGITFFRYLSSITLSVQKNNIY